jgi:hypothetical protein
MAEPEIVTFVARRRVGTNLVIRISESERPYRTLEPLRLAIRMAMAGDNEALEQIIGPCAIAMEPRIEEWDASLPAELVDRAGGTAGWNSLSREEQKDLALQVYGPRWEELHEELFRRTPRSSWEERLREVLRRLSEEAPA